MYMYIYICIAVRKIEKLDLGEKALYCPHPLSFPDPDPDPSGSDHGSHVKHGSHGNYGHDRQSFDLLYIGHLRTFNITAQFMELAFQRTSAWYI